MIQESKKHVIKKLNRGRRRKMRKLQSKEKSKKKPIGK